MSRPRKWGSDAERMAARRAAETAPASSGHEVPENLPPDEVPTGGAARDSAGGQVVVPAEKLPASGAGSTPAGTVVWQGQTWPIVRAPVGGITRAGYVAGARLAAEHELLKGRTNPIVNGEDRIGRAVRYAEWRFDGWQAGQVDGL